MADYIFTFQIQYGECFFIDKEYFMLTIQTDRIAVQVSDEIKIYAPSNNGNNVTLTSDDPFYWQSKDETKTIRAWYCGDSSTASGGINTGGVPTSWSVQPDQNEGEGYQQSDFLYAAPKDISFGSRNGLLPILLQCRM